MIDEKNFYPDLKIVPISDIQLQEYVQKNRVKKLAEEIEKEGILRNPPIVTNFINGTYMHLDGANRITAIQLLKYQSCLVQVVDYSDPSHVRLMSWSHLICVDEHTFIASILKMKDLIIRESSSYHHKMLLNPRLVCLIMFKDGVVREVTSTQSALEKVVNSIGQIVSLYENTQVERVFSSSPWSHASIITRFKRHSDDNVFIVFPNFSPSQVISLVDQNILMPAGLTRHVVYRRKLNVNMPLEFLNIQPVEKANEALQKFLQHRSVRLYEEPVIYFE